MADSVYIDTREKVLVPEDDEYCPVGDTKHADDNKEPSPNMHCTCWYEGDGCCRCGAAAMTEQEKRDNGMLDDLDCGPC